MFPSKQQVYGLDGDEDDHEKWSFWHRLKEVTSPEMKDIARYCPLAAAILAPLSTLLDIPALSQHWYELYDEPQDDPAACLALSAVGLGLNVLANLLLLLRFSTRSQAYTSIATRISLLSWIGKTLVAAVNLIVFGVVARNGPGYSFDEGFWCAVVSIIDAGIITILLLLHYFYAFRPGGDHDLDLRMQGRQFMLSVTAFLGILAIQALAFSKIEGWSYLDSIYFSVQTALTIGFGDYSPEHTAGKVLVFIFSVLTISQLGNEIALIIAFISAHANERRDRWRRRYEGMMHRQANVKRPDAGLIEEMALIHQINSREEMMSQLYDLVWSGIALIAFWVVGAAMFSQIEGWTYGNALYAVMVLSLTIGFGDFTPETPAGKVVFVVYALMAVPIVTSFAVQTITGLTHTEYIVKAHETYKEMRDRLLGSPDDEGEKVVDNGDGEEVRDIEDGEKAAAEAEPQDTADNVAKELNDAEKRVVRESAAVESIVKRRGRSDGAEGDEKDERALEMKLVRQLLDLTVRLEAEAREMLLDTMEHGISRTLLLADRNVQIRDVRAVRGDEANILGIWRGINQNNARPSEHPSTIGKLAKVRQYRNTFAEILVIGSILQRLEGDELNQFERWKAREEKQIEQEKQLQQVLGQEDLERIADEQFDGITSRAVRQHMRRVKDSKGKLSCISHV